MKLLLKDDKRNLFIKTVVWNQIICIFKQEKNIDIEKYLISIQTRWKTIIIKTNKPIINGECIFLERTIKNTLEEKFKSIWEDIYEYELKYL